MSLAQELGRPPGELAVIHVSLATTFGDLGEPVQALHHYRQELALHRGNALEVSGGGTPGDPGSPGEASWGPGDGGLGTQKELFGVLEGLLRALG